MAVGATKRIVCLANSRKPRGSCIAGKELLPDGRPGDWVRPVSPWRTGGVPEHLQRYTDGSIPKVLDVIDVPVLNFQPKQYQTENWLLDTKRRWTKVNQLQVNDLAPFVDAEAHLWANAYNSSNGHNNRVPPSIAEHLTDSLKLIRVDGLTLQVSQPYQNRTVRGRFNYAGSDYLLSVTDPIWENQYKPRPDGNYPIGSTILAISLGELFEDQYNEVFAYKLIAAIITP